MRHAPDRGLIVDDQNAGSVANVWEIQKAEPFVEVSPTAPAGGTGREYYTPQQRYLLVMQVTTVSSRLSRLGPAPAILQPRAALIVSRAR